jgi:hypothetical protein
VIGALSTRDGLKSRKVGGNEVRRISWSPIVLQKFDGSMWLLAEPLTIRVELRGSSGVLEMTAKRGWLTDLGSVPRRLKGIVDDGSEDETCLAAYLFHDAAYAINFPHRERADLILLETLHASRLMGWLESRLAWLAVRLAGHGPWSHSEAEIAESLESVQIRWVDR